MNHNTPSNIVERLEASLRGTVYATKKDRNKTILRDYGHPFGRSKNSMGASLKLSDYVNGKSKSLNETYSREFAEVHWAKAAALAIHLTSGFEVYSKNGISEFFEERKKLGKIASELRATGDDVYKNPEYVAAKNKAYEAWQRRFSPEHNSASILDKTHKAQDSLLSEFSSQAVKLGYIDHSSLFRLEKLVRENIKSLNNGVHENELANPAQMYQHKAELYELMLSETYQADTKSLQLLGKNMFQEHLSEIQSYADSQKYTSSSGKRVDFDIDLNSYADSPTIGENGAKVGGIAKEFHHKGGKKSEWSVAAGIRVFYNDKNPSDITPTVSLAVGISLIGRDSTFISFKPDFKGWCERLPCAPLGNEANLTAEQARLAHETRQKELADKIAASAKEAELKHQQKMQEIAEANAKREIEVKTLIDANFEKPELTKDSVKGTYIQKKHLEALLNYPELHGLMRLTSLYDQPAVSIQMGPNVEETRGLQFLAHNGSPWNKENPTNKMFEVMNDDMKNNFVQLGNITPKTTIITSEGFANGGSLFIAAKERGLDVAVVCAMFANNISHAIKRYSQDYPNNPLLNASDNDCFLKAPTSEHSIRALNLNTGAKVALQAYDEFGVKSFSVDWEKLDVLPEATAIKATDYNNLFDIFEYDKAIEVMGDQLELVISNNTTPSKEYVAPRKFLDAERDKFTDIFDAYGIDGTLLTTSFPVGMQFETPKAVSVEQERIDHRVSELPVQEANVAPNEHNIERIVSYSLQRHIDGDWQTIEKADTAKEILINLEIEKGHAVQIAYEKFSQAEKNLDSAYTKALEYVGSTYRCFDEESKVPFTSADTYNDIRDIQLAHDVVLLVENETGTFARPIRVSEDGELVIGGSKGLKQPRYNSRADLAQDINAVVESIYFSNNNYQWLTDHNFVLRDIDADGKPDRTTSRTFEEEFGLSVSEVMSTLVDPRSIQAKLENSNQTIKINCTTTNELEPVTELEIDSNEVAYELDRISSQPNIIDIDTSAFSSADQNFYIEPAERQSKPYTVKSFAPNGAVNGNYEFDSLALAENKIDALNGTKFIIPTTVYYISKHGETPISTTIDPVDLPLLQPKAPLQEEPGQLSRELETCLVQIDSTDWGTYELPISNDTPIMLNQEGSWVNASTGEPTKTLSLIELYNIENAHTEGLDNDNELTLDSTNFAELAADGGFDIDFREQYTGLDHDLIETTHEIEPIVDDFNFDIDTLANLDMNELEPEIEGAQLEQLKENIVDAIDLETDNEPVNHEQELTNPDAWSDELTHGNHNLEESIEVEAETDSPELLDNADDWLDELSELDAPSFKPSTIDPLESDMPDFSGMEDVEWGLDDFGIDEEEQTISVAGSEHVENQGTIDLFELADQEVEVQSVSNEQPSSVSQAERHSIDTTINDVSIELGQVDPKSDGLDLKHQKTTGVGERSLAEQSMEKIDRTTDVLVNSTTRPPNSDEQVIKTNTGAKSLSQLVLDELNATSINFSDQFTPKDTFVGISSFTTVGAWADSSKYWKSTTTVEASTLNVRSEIDLPLVDVEAPDVNVPTTEQLTSIFDKSKQKAWNEQRAANSIQAQVEMFEEIALSENQNFNANLDVAPDLDGTSSSYNPNSEQTSSDAIPSKDTTSPDIENTAPANEIKDESRNGQHQSEIEKELLKVLQSLKSSDKESVAHLTGLLTNIAESAAKNAIDVHDVTSRIETPHKVEVTNQSEEPIQVVTKTFSETTKVNINDFDFDDNPDVKAYVKLANELVGDKGQSAIQKKAAFLYASKTSPESDTKELTQKALEVLVSIKKPEDNLAKQEYASKASEIGNWLATEARVGMMIESTRNEQGYVTKFSALDKKLHAKVHEYLTTPSSPIKGANDPIYFSRICLKDAIEKRQIPEDTLRQALFGIWNSPVGNTGELSKYYNKVATRLHETGVRKVVNDLKEKGIIENDPSSRQNLLYEDPLDGTQKSLKISSLKSAAAGLVAEREIQAAKEMPRTAKKNQREPYSYFVAKAFENLTEISTPLKTEIDLDKPWRATLRRGDGSRSDMNSKEQETMEITR
ncbi:hypothetical protein BJL79_19895 [Vibrio parahaemolyticus]|uniref:hypothetical protein n=1 Tax=Vibrio parahaemolyticus TaxID=670 RepID=UPI000998E8CF|nr:hypothetical protein [Vibrio parahaemolyticus]OOX55914.1 hypothetical protein BJL79_19895 [Vibrio parahaemolyticus]